MCGNINVIMNTTKIVFLTCTINYKASYDLCISVERPVSYSVSCSYCDTLLMLSFWLVYLRTKNYEGKMLSFL